MVCVGHYLAVCCRAEFGCKSSPRLHFLRICAPMATQHAFWRLGEQSCGGRLRVFMFRNCGADFARQESCQPRNIERTKRAHRCFTGQIFFQNFPCMADNRGQAWPSSPPLMPTSNSRAKRSIPHRILPSTHIEKAFECPSSLIPASPYFFKNNFAACKHPPRVKGENPAL